MLIVLGRFEDVQSGTNCARVAGEGYLMVFNGKNFPIDTNVIKVNFDTIFWAQPVLQNYLFLGLLRPP